MEAPMAALPNLFEFIIAEAVAQEGATTERVAMAIAASAPFLKAVRKGMEHDEPPGGMPLTKAQVMRGVLAKAFSAPTANQMFDF